MPAPSSPSASSPSAPSSRPAGSSPSAPSSLSADPPASAPSGSAVRPFSAAPPSILDFLDYRSFLEARFEWMKARDPRFSMRRIHRLLGLSPQSTSFLSGVVRGKRKLSSRLRMRLSGYFKLSAREDQHFELLVRLAQSDDSLERERLFSRLAAQRGTSARKLAETHYRFYGRFHYLVLWNLLGLPKPPRRVEEMAKRIFPPVSIAQIEEALGTLLELGLVHRKANGYGLSERHLTVEKEAQALLFREAHAAALAQALHALREVPAAARRFNSMVFSASPQALEAIKEKLDTLHHEIRFILDRDREEDRIYVLNLQLFPAATPF